VSREIKKIEDFYLNSESESSKEKRFTVIKSIIETNNEPIQALQDFFIQKGDEVLFIEQIEKEARNLSVKFDIDIDIKENQADPFKEDVEVKIKINGSWRNIISFIDKLEKMPFGVLIENINLDADVSGNWSGLIELIIFREK
jgi:hypothetical protein